MRIATPHKPAVLVVEDDPDVRRMLGLSLEHFGFTVHLAADGPEAIGLYQQHHPSIALILLDVQMPGMDGPQTLAALRSIEPDLRCCFMSGNTGKYTIGQLLALGAIQVFDKPFGSLAELARTLQQLAGAESEERKVPS